MKTLFKNINVVDVLKNKIYQSNVLVEDEYIKDIDSNIYEADTIIDGTNKYIYPSFIDTHLHFESTQIRPSEYLKVAISYGTTAFITDPHEITNVCGEDGIKFICDEIKDVPADVKVMMPSCVPATPLEHNGYKIDNKETYRITKKYNLYGLGEMMDINGMLSDDPNIKEKIDYFKKNNMIVDGHAPGLSGDALKKYISYGIYTDHETTNATEALEKIKCGMKILIRNGSASKDCAPLVKIINKDNLDCFAFSTDDKEPEDLYNKGTIIDAIKIAINNGVDKIDAIRIASYNGYKIFRLENRGLIEKGYYANFIIASNLDFDKNIDVYYKGKMVAHNNKALFNLNKADITNVIHSVHHKNIDISDLKLEFNPNMTVMEIVPNTLLTKGIKQTSCEGLNKLYSIERHHSLPLIGKCFVKGFNLKDGAIAQTIGHDSHNIIALGDKEEDILDVINALGVDGGIAIKSNNKIVYFKLDIAGLMSSSTIEDVLKRRYELHEALSELSMNNSINPLMLLSFLSLIVIPDVKLTCEGLYSFNQKKYID